MILSAFWAYLVWGGISILRVQGRIVGWTKYAQLVFWIGLFGFWVWRGIEAGKRNRQERIEREAEFSPLENR
jgi:hypothetical protein